MSEEKPEEVEPVDEDRAGSEPDVVLGEELGSIGWIWSGRRTWRPSPEVSSRAENCNLSAIAQLWLSSRPSSLSVSPEFDAALEAAARSLLSHSSISGEAKAEGGRVRIQSNSRWSSAPSVSAV